MRTVIKRRLTNSLTTKTSQRKKTLEDKVNTKVRTGTKRGALLQGNLSGLTKSIWSNRRWRRVLAYYAIGPSKVPPDGASTIEILEGKDSKEESVDDFYTFENAPSGIFSDDAAASEMSLVWGYACSVSPRRASSVGKQKYPLAGPVSDA